MKKLLSFTLFLLLITFPLNTMAQVKRVDIDTKHFTFSYLEAPSKPMYYNRDDEHQYTVMGKYEPSFELYFRSINAEEAVVVNGWQKVWREGNPSVTVYFYGSDLKSKAEIQDKTTKKKDKNGVEYLEHYYVAHIVFGNGKMNYSLMDNASHKTFYQSFDVSSDDIVLEYTSVSYARRRDAEKDMSKNLDIQRLNALGLWNDKIVNIVSNRVTAIIGWYFSRQNISLKVTDEKKFDENASNIEHYKATRAIIENMDARQDLDIIEQQLQPEMDYYGSLLDRYQQANDNNIDGRMRALALYNLAYINFALERYDAATLYANKYIANGYEPKDGNKIIKEINKVKEYYAKYGVNTQHPNIMFYN